MRFKHSRDKFIPGAIFGLSKKQVAIFLSRLYSTDGWATVCKGRGVEIGFASVSHQLCLDVQELLLRFGINAWINPKPKTNSYTVRIGASSDAIRFCEEIGIYGKERQVSAVLSEAQRMSQDRRVQRWRERDIPANLRWEAVKSIEYIGEDQTVAIEVPGHHHYLTTFWEHNSYVVSCAVLWHVFAIGGLAITTAPTEAQVKEILWSEIRKLWDAHHTKLGGKRGELFLKLNEHARAYGFTARDYSTDSFQGKHGVKMLLILDEANGITETIDDGARACATGSQNRLVRIGNPTAGGTPFEIACLRRSIAIPVWGHPNVGWAYYKDDHTGYHRLRPEVDAAIRGRDGEILPQELWPDWCPRDVIPGAVSIQWIEDVRRDKGEGSTFWQGRVEGEFPTDAEGSIVPRSWFKAARERYDSDPEYWDTLADKGTWRHGLDVGDGGDPHALASWKGPVLYFAREYPTRGDRLDVSRAAAIAKERLRIAPGTINVDRVGVGAGTLSILMEEDVQAYGIAWGSAVRAEDLQPDDPVFLNLKAMQYWRVRQAMQVDDQVAIAPLGDYEEVAMRDLAGTYYEETSNEKTRIEDKKKTKARLHRSPNLGDAIVLAYSKPTEFWADLLYAE